MRKHVVALMGALLACSTQAYAQPPAMYHWRSFTESASVMHSAEDGYYQIYVEKYGPLRETEGWPVRARVSFVLGFAGVQGACWVPANAVVLDDRTGELRLWATVPFADGCDWLDGAASVELQVTWRPDGTYHSRRHYTLLGDTGGTSSEQGWDDRWLFAGVTGTVTVNGDQSMPIPPDQNGSTFRGWGHGVIPLFLSLVR